MTTQKHWGGSVDQARHLEEKRRRFAASAGMSPEKAQQLSNTFRLNFPQADEYLEHMKKVHEEQSKSVLGSTIGTPLRGEAQKTQEMITCFCGRSEPRRHPGHTFCSPICSQEAAASMALHEPRRLAAERALAFMAGLNLQDHSVKDQREQLEVVRALQVALRPKKAGK